MFSWSHCTDSLPPSKFFVSHFFQAFIAWNTIFNTGEQPDLSVEYCVSAFNSSYTIILVFSPSQIQKVETLFYVMAGWRFKNFKKIMQEVRMEMDKGQTQCLPCLFKIFMLVYQCKSKKKKHTS